MRPFLMVGLLCLGCALCVRAADEPDPEPAPADWKKLEGEWVVTTLKLSGTEKKLPNTFNYTWTVSKGKITMKMKGAGKEQEKVATFKIDARKNPRHLDLTAVNTRMVTHYIYKLDRDELTIAYGGKALTDRPKDFASARQVMVLKRKKKGA
jgi:uncharacterized protein (TIGR03067 family)